MAGNIAMSGRTLSGCGPKQGSRNTRMIEAYLFTYLKEAAGKISAFEGGDASPVIHTYVPTDPNYFRPYATDFEKEFSILLRGPYGASPVVDVNPTGATVPAVSFECVQFEYPIVGHVGWFSGDTICAPRESGQVPDLTKLSGKEGLIVRRNPPKGFYNVRSSEERFFLVTDIHGKLLWWPRGESTGATQGTSPLKTAVVAGVRKVLGVTTVDLLTMMLL